MHLNRDCTLTALGSERRGRRVDAKTKSRPRTPGNISLARSSQVFQFERGKPRVVMLSVTASAHRGDKGNNG